MEKAIKTYDRGDIVKGTEKQIALATEIRARVIKALEYWVEYVQSIPALKDSDIVDAIRLRIERLVEEDVSAKNIIETFQWIRFYDNIEEAAEILFSRYRENNEAYSNGVRHLLGWDVDDVISNRLKNAREEVFSPFDDSKMCEAIKKHSLTNREIDKIYFGATWLDTSPVEVYRNFEDCVGPKTPDSFIVYEDCKYGSHTYEVRFCVVDEEVMCPPFRFPSSELPTSIDWSSAGEWLKQMYHRIDHGQVKDARVLFNGDWYRPNAIIDPDARYNKGTIIDDSDLIYNWRDSVRTQWIRELNISKGL